MQGKVLGGVAGGDPLDSDRQGLTGWDQALWGRPKMVDRPQGSTVVSVEAEMNYCSKLIGLR